MSLQNSLVSIVGGSGFVGSYIVKAFVKAGARVRVISRNPNRSEFLKTFGSVGQVELVSCNIQNDSLLREALLGSEVVVNAVGILYQHGNQRFPAIHAQAPERIAKIVSDLGIKSFIHISAIGADKCTSSSYASSKLNGERGILAAFPKATILRPSIIFGPEDQFFNRFAAIAALSPALPLIGGGKTRFQPVYVADVALAALHCAEHPETRGKIYELGGPDIVSFKEILTYILKTTHRCRALISIPYGIAKLAGVFMSFAPRPLLTADQVELLKTDNVVDDNALGFKDLGITTRSYKLIASQYLISNPK